MLSAPQFGIYVHWPFCAAKCPYCDFNSHVPRNPIDEKRFLKAYQAELAYWASQTDYAHVDTIFFGGGTPSLMSPYLVEGILAAIAKHWQFADDVEISLEANPQSVDAENFAGFAQAGVNRVSIGVQSFNDKALQTLGRLHRSREAIRAIEIAKSSFERFSFDLIYARPKQSLDLWREELEQALAFKPQHLSLYQLTIEPETPYMALYQSGKLRLPDEDLAVNFYEIAQDYCVVAGLEPYEVSNHAKPGEEARHNLLYWRYGDFLGIGPGAHGRVSCDGKRVASLTERSPVNWLELVESQGHGLVSVETIDLSRQALEMILMGMRLQTGISLSDLEIRTGHGIAQSTIDEMKSEGLLVNDERRGNDHWIRTTPKGRLLLNHLLAKLTEGLSEC